MLATGQQRYREALWDAAEEFVDLKTVRKRMRCSSGFCTVWSTSNSNYDAVLGSVHGLTKWESTSTSFEGTSRWTSESS